MHFIDKVKLKLISSIKAHPLLLRRGSASILIKVGYTALSFLLTVTLSRMLGPTEFGAYAFAISVMTLLAIPSQLGLPQLLIRETARYEVEQEWSLIRGLWSWSSIIVWLFSSFLVVVSLITIGLYCHFNNTESFDSTFLYRFVLIPIIALSNLRSAALKGLRKVIIGQLPENIIRPALFVSILLVASSMTLGLDSGDAMLVNIAASLVTFFIGAFFLSIFKPENVNIKTKPEYQSHRWLKSTLPLALIAGMQVINTQVDTVMLGVLSNKEEVGVYKVVVSAGMLVVFGLQAISSVVAPYFAQIYNTNQLSKLQKLVSTSCKLTFLLALPVVIIYIAFGDILLGITFGDDYKSGYNSLVILSIAQLLNASFGAIGFLLSMTGYEKKSLEAIGLASLSNIIMNALLIPLYGALGAAIATSVTLLIWNVYMWKVVKEKLKINSWVINFKKGEL